MVSLGFVRPAASDTEPNLQPSSDGDSNNNNHSNHGSDVVTPGSGDYANVGSDGRLVGELVPSSNATVHGFAIVEEEEDTDIFGDSLVLHAQLLSPRRFPAVSRSASMLQGPIFVGRLPMPVPASSLSSSSRYARLPPPRPVVPPRTVSQRPLPSVPQPSAKLQPVESLPQSQPSQPPLPSQPAPMSAAAVGRMALVSMFHKVSRV